MTPAIFMILFVYLFGGSASGSTDTGLRYLFPGVLVMGAGIAGMLSCGLTIDIDMKKGVYDRFRGLPIGRPSPLPRPNIQVPWSRGRFGHTCNVAGRPTRVAERQGLWLPRCRHEDGGRSGRWVRRRPPRSVEEGTEMNLRHHHVEVNGLRLHVAEQGEGPLVLLLHGFPESWYSWRHQFAPLAEAGYRVVAPDQRGYAHSDRAASVDEYSMPHLVGDVVALIAALGAQDAVVVGHDWGAPIAWTTALLRPDLVRGVVGLSVPPVPPAGMPSVESSRKIYGDRYYQAYFQEPGRADAELAADPTTTLRRLLVTASGDGPSPEPVPWIVPEGAGVVESLPEPAELPAWLTPEDLAVFAEDHSAPDAFTGPLNWYRNIDRNQGLMAAFQGLRIEVPALYMVGDKDMVTALKGVAELREVLRGIVPKLHADITLAGCGHWTQQERPEEVNAALLDFLRSV